MSNEFFARKGGKYDYIFDRDEESGKVSHTQLYRVYKRDYGKYGEAFTSLEAAKAEAQRLNDDLAVERAREEVAVAKIREQRAAEEARRESLTDDERQREDDFEALRYQRFALDQHNNGMIRQVTNIAEALEQAAADIRDTVERYQSNSDQHKYMHAEFLVRQVMDTLFFLPQHTRQQYLVSDSYQVIHDRNKGIELTEKLGLPRDDAYPERKNAETEGTEEEVTA